MHPPQLILKLVHLSSDVQKLLTRSNDDDRGQYKLQEHRCCGGSEGLSACKEGTEGEGSLSCDFAEHPRVSQCNRNEVPKGGQSDEDRQNACTGVVSKHRREEFASEELT
jgi:hypothetical protein